MPRRKLHRFVQNSIAPNVIENGKPTYQISKGNWHSEHFKNKNPIVLELGCGKGEYTLGLARQYPNTNFIGIDVKGDRIARGSQQALSEGLSNVRFLRTDIQYLHEFFTSDEVSEIWITFPDPQLRDKQEKHRLTHPRFLAMYSDMLALNGILHLKTDNRSFFEYSLETLPRFGFSDLIHTYDLYQSELNSLHFGIKTKYEAMFYDKGYSINYLQCKNTKGNTH
ncbi:MAG: tRNA (guanosine(46)-N7)-methyltransferase TrmB [Cytophagales bacterium]|nr:MAG: tRNA (guanosine(46)-N7)-methyltransferase TrmB [Cytophagales bacterium]